MGCVRTCLFAMALVILTGWRVADVSTAAIGGQSIREMLTSVADASRSLAASAVECDPAVLKKAALHPYNTLPMNDDEGSLVRIVEGAVFPTEDQLKQYGAIRPWASAYGPRYSCGNPSPIKAESAPKFRELLSDADPALRSLAIEALALLGLPEDVPRIAALMSQTAQGAPLLGWNMPLNAVFFETGPYWGNPASPVIRRSWRSMTVGGYAKRSICYMTGVRLDEKTFPGWWRTHSRAKQCLWYWQQRAIHGMMEIEASSSPPESRDYGAWNAEQGAKKRAFMRHLFSELGRESPEVEAKVRLLIADHHIAPDPVGGLAVDSRIRLRVGPERLVRLLEGKGLWPDVDWGDGQYSTDMAQRILLHTDGIGREFVPRLRAIYEKGTGRPSSALVIKISRLLPTSGASDLDDPDTRDGMLRRAIRASEDTFASGEIARELTSVGLPQNWPFLKEQFFAESNPMHCVPDVRTSIIRALGEPPLSAQKRAALLDVLLDSRFRPIWTQQNPGFEDIGHRESAVESINAHAGRKVLADKDIRMLSDPATSEAALTSVLERIRSLSR